MKITQKLASFVFPSPRQSRKSNNEDHKKNLIKPNAAVASAANVYQQDELRGAKEVSRCQFTFSDGRQCRMQQAKFCPHHSSREKPEDRGNGFPDEGLVGLGALCGDLTTASNINRALSQVFLLTAQGRISQKQAVAFGYLSQLLLQTVPGIRSEYVSAHGYQAWQNNLKCKLDAAPESSFRPPAKVYPQDELLPVNEVNASEKSLCAPSPVPEPYPAGENRTSPDIVILSDERRASPNPSLPASRENSVNEGTLSDPSKRPDYTSIFHRSLDLLDRKFDTTPEGRREASALMAELKVIDRARAKPRKDVPHPPPNPSPSPAPASCSSGRGRAVCDRGLRQLPAPISAITAGTPSPSAPPAAPETPFFSSGRGAVQPALRPLSPAAQPAADATVPRHCKKHAAPSPPTEPSPAPFRSAPPAPAGTPAGTAHTTDWYAPASWSGRPLPNPFPSRQERQRREHRSNLNDRRWQHRMQNPNFWE